MDALKMFEPEKTVDSKSLITDSGGVSTLCRHNRLTVFDVIAIVPSEKDFVEDKDIGLVDWDSSRDDHHPSTPGKKRKTDDRQPESPPEIARQNARSNWHREKHFGSHRMDTDSPATYAKHIGDSHYNASYQDRSPSKSTVSTPVLTDEYGYEHPSYRPSNYFPNTYDTGYHPSSSRQPRGHYDVEYAAPCPPAQDGYMMRPRRWACDYCQVATFVSYEEACAHEEACARSYHERYGGRPHPSRGPVPQYDQTPTRGWTDLPPPRGHQQMWGRGPPMPLLPPPEHHQSLYDYHSPPPRYPSAPAYPVYPNQDISRHRYESSSPKRLMLAMPTDVESLSDRQCYVRSEMVEIFAATEKDVSARHSKGAQRLVVGQVGIRCVHCSHLRPRDRAERAVCYPSSISRVYQTVADMQRFHFEQCREIPPETRKIYKSLKTTRPRGVGSPQTYWVQSARLLNLVDTENGIRFSTDLNSPPSLDIQQLDDHEDTDTP